MDSTELLKAYLSKAHNLDSSGVDSLLFDESGNLVENALSNLENLEAERVKKLRESVNFSDAYKKAKGEVMKDWESKFKRITGLASDKQGDELIHEYLDSVNQQLQTTGKITDDDVKKHPLYLRLQDEMNNKIQEVEKTWSEKLNQFDSNIKKEKTYERVQSLAWDLLNKKRPILSKDPEKAKRQLKLLYDDLRQYEYDIQSDNGSERVVIMKDGKVLEDNLAHAIKFDKLVDSISNNYYDFEAAEERSAPASSSKITAPVNSSFGFDLQSIGLNKPKNQAEWFKGYEQIERNATLSPSEKQAAQQLLMTEYKSSAEQ